MPHVTIASCEFLFFSVNMAKLIANLFVVNYLH